MELYFHMWWFFYAVFIFTVSLQYALESGLFMLVHLKTEFPSKIFNEKTLHMVCRHDFSLSFPKFMSGILSLTV